MPDDPQNRMPKRMQTRRHQYLSVCQTKRWDMLRWQLAWHVALEFVGHLTWLSCILWPPRIHRPWISLLPVLCPQTSFTMLNGNLSRCISSNEICANVTQTKAEANVCECRVLTSGRMWPSLSPIRNFETNERPSCSTSNRSCRCPGTIGHNDVFEFVWAHGDTGSAHQQLRKWQGPPKPWDGQT